MWKGHVIPLLSHLIQQFLPCWNHFKEYVRSKAIHNLEITLIGYKYGHINEHWVSRRQIHFQLTSRKLSIMTFNFLLLLPLIARFKDLIKFNSPENANYLCGQNQVHGPGEPLRWDQFGSLLGRAGQPHEELHRHPWQVLKLKTHKYRNTPKVQKCQRAPYIANIDRCSVLCEKYNNCEYWIAQWDGSQCQLLTTDYRYVSASSIFS